MSSNKVTDAAPARPPRGGAAGCEGSPSFGSGNGSTRDPGVLSPSIHSTDLRMFTDFFSHSATDAIVLPPAAMRVSVNLRWGYFETSIFSWTCAFHLP